MKIEVTPRPGDGRPTCVFCRAAVEREQSLVLCPSCGSTLHQGCRAELTRCATPGCEGLPPPAETARRAPETPWPRVAPSSARDDPDLIRARSAQEHVLWALGGALLGLGVAALFYYLQARRFEGADLTLWSAAGAGIGAVEASIIAWLGIRAEPIVNIRGKGGDQGAVPLVLFTTFAAGLATGAAGGPVAGLVVALAVFALALRWFGWW